MHRIMSIKWNVFTNSPKKRVFYHYSQHVIQADDGGQTVLALDFQTSEMSNADVYIIAYIIDNGVINKI